MGQRLELQQILEDLLGSRNVYFQPPSNLQLSFPCIVYKRDNIRDSFASNVVYRRARRYLITVIDRDPDSPIPDLVLDLPFCSLDRHYTNDNLNHTVFSIFF